MTATIHITYATVVPKQYCKDHQENICQTKIMSTPITHNTEISGSGANRRLREMLNMMTANKITHL